jgi:hypothetical protein
MEEDKSFWGFVVEKPSRYLGLLAPAIIAVGAVIVGGGWIIPIVSVAWFSLFIINLYLRSKR